MTRVAIYAGTFDPITLGHLSVIEKAARMFDEVVVVVAINPSKQPTFTTDERIDMIRACADPLTNVRCASTPGFVVHLARELGARFLVRGVRGATDTEAEIALAHANHELAPEIATVFLPAARDLAEVSSSRLKELARAGADVSAYCCPTVAERLARVLGTEPTHERV